MYNQTSPDLIYMYTDSLAIFIKELVYVYYAMSVHTFVKNGGITYFYVRVKPYHLTPYTVYVRIII